MRVLIAAPHDFSNPYCRELGAGYHAAGCEVVYGLDLFWTGHIAVDLVHLQWPEHLVPEWFSPAEQLPALGERIAEWRRTARVIATVHNARPHRPRADWWQLFDAVYASCDGIIHHGERSVSWFSEQFPRLATTPHLVAPFGAYTSYPRTVFRQEARARLGVHHDERVVLVFSRFRTVREFVLVARGFARARVPRKCLVLTWGLPARRFGSLRNAGLRLLFLAGRRHRLLAPVLSASEVQLPLLAADVMLIQRVGGLNSSSVPLAFTFGLPVVCPDVGVFGEHARAHGNVTFPPGRAAAVARALEEAFSQDLVAMGRRNRAVAEGLWSWPVVARAILDFAATLVAQRGQGSESP